ncbi:MAG: BMP family ABC transporter substrate-binding protein [Cytophagales bacterium]|nr:BMP family ABC transporter substrate-binding protein [Armatimonadota bacterium]
MTNPLTGVRTTASRRPVSALVSLVTLCAVSLLITGCPTTSTTPPATQGGTSTVTPPATTSNIKAGLVTDVGGINDKSFNASAWDGLQRAGKELGIAVKFTESKQNADYVSNLTQYARGGYDVVFALGFRMQDALKEVAPRYPKVKFAIIDGDAPPLPNCAAYKFREEQGSYLVGALAGLMTKSNKVGFIGGEQMPLIEKFQAGYAAGVKATNPQAQVVVGYAQSFVDASKGQEIAISQMGSGADILYHASGNVGTGVIKAVAAKGTGFYAIGVDKDQDGDAPGRVLTSMVKRVDTAVFDVCKSVTTDSFKSGTVTLGLKEGGVSLSEMKYTKKDVPPAVLQKIDGLKADIIAGTVTPPTTIGP